VMQSVINALTKGGKIFVKAGTYSLSATLTIPYDFIDIYGEGFSTVVKLADNVNDDVILVKKSDLSAIEGVKISNLYIDGNGAVQTSGSGLHFYRSQRCEIDRVKIYYVKERAIYLEGKSSTETSFYNKIVGCDIHRGDGNGIELLNANDNSIETNWISQSSPSGTNSGIRIRGSSSNRFISNHIIGFIYGVYITSGNANEFLANEIEKNQKHGVYISPGVGSGGADRNKFIANLIYENSQEGNNLYDGIRLEGSPSPDDIQRTIIVCNEIRRITNQNYAIYEGPNVDYSEIERNDVVDHINKIYKQGAETKVKYNLGYATESSGTATIAAGNTYVDVTHELSITPSLKKIGLTPQTDLEGRDIWVSNPTSTTFRINISSVDTKDNIIGWRYN